MRAQTGMFPPNEAASRSTLLRERPVCSERLSDLRAHAGPVQYFPYAEVPHLRFPPHRHALEILFQTLGETYVQRKAPWTRYVYHSFPSVHLPCISLYLRSPGLLYFPALGIFVPGRRSLAHVLP